jgi:uncharacterized membrane protein
MRPASSASATLSSSSLSTGLTAALTIAISTAFLATPVAAAEPAKAQEKCFGVALKGKNDCAAGPGTSCAGSSKLDHQSDAWVFVPKGTCEKVASKTSPTGFGKLAEFKASKKS